MQARRRKNGHLPWAALALGLAMLIPAKRAQAHEWHHHRHYEPHPIYHAPAPMPAPVSAGFGPTSPGPSTILIDAATGRVISESGADIPRYPASLTKLMVLDLAFQALRDGRMTLNTAIPVSYHAAAVEPVKLGLAPGQTLTVRQAILAMTTMSANDAATALGEYLGGGSEDRCAQMMTLRAQALGMAQTQFYNASGLPNPGQITTARDLAILARDIVVNYPEDQQYFEVTEFDFNGHSVFSNNNMLRSYPGATGMKTGYTILARHNLITSAQRNGVTLIGVELHEPSWGTTYAQMTAMLNAGYGVPGANTQFAANTPPAAPAPVPVPAPVAQLHRLPASAGNWIAQLGIYSRMSKARIEAIEAQQMRGVGIPRIARVERHGRTLWTAQLAGLTFTAAHQTCNALAARGTSCRIIPPSTDHLALIDSADGT